MKKVIFGLAVVAAAAFGVYTANKDNAEAQMSNLQLENVEALAQTVEITVGKICQFKYNAWCQWMDGFIQPGQFMR
ncbi:MAG: hypothetical protein IKP73_11715 [Bacteroidales bacterium]|nr:hypothetical protein [Bacteroidales bacterium]